MKTGIEEGVIVWDIISYYTYLPATFIYNDVSLSYAFEENADPVVQGKTWSYKLPNGNRVLKMSMGVAIMCTPAFLVAHSLAPLLGYTANGYTPPYTFSVIASSVLALFFGLLFLRKFLLKYYSDWICTFTLLIIALATNLLWYSTFDAGMSHVFSFCMVSIFLLLIEKWYKKPSYSASILLGLTLGMISLIRPTNCVFVILFLFWGISNKETIKERWALYRRNIVKLITLSIFVLVAWMPQIFYWKYLTGDFFFYSYMDNERFFFMDPKIWSILFGFRKGLFIYTPTMIFAFIGMFMIWKSNKTWALPSAIFLIVNIYVISSWWCWWYGGSLGMRAMIDSYPLLAIGLATFLVWVASLKRKLWKIPLIAIIVLFSFQTIFFTIQYNYQTLHYDSMTRKALMAAFWRVRATDKYYDALKEPDYEEGRAGKREE